MMEDHGMKKKAAAEALHELIQQMMGIEGKKHTMPMEGSAEEEGGESLKDKLSEAGMVGGQKQDAMAGTPEDGEMSDEAARERKDFMSFKKKPIMEKSMTVVMAAPKMKKKMRG